MLLLLILILLLLLIFIIIIIIIIIIITRDILNQKYFDKRKLYLGGLAKSLSNIRSESNNEEFDYEISFSWFKGDMRKPILEINSPFIHSNSKIIIRLIPAVR